MNGRVTSQSIFARLRDCVDAAQRLGRGSGWVPEVGSPSAEIWKAASKQWQTAEEALAVTVAEAEVHAVALIQSGLEHADVVARTVARGLAHVPHTVARTTEEHLLRALHYLDTGRVDVIGSPDDQVAIAEVRLNQVLSNLTESERLHGGVVSSDWAHLVDGDAVTGNWEQARARAQALGWQVVQVRRVWRLAGTTGRASTMDLMAKYLADADTSQFDGRVITQLIARARGSAAHGYETGLLASTRIEPRDDLPFAALDIEPQQMEVGELAFHLMTVPLAVGNTIDAVVRRFGWSDSKLLVTYESRRTQMIEAWVRAINESRS